MISIVLILAVAATRVQLYNRANRRPLDVKSMQAEMLERLGLSLPADISTSEFGLNMMLEDVVAADGTERVLCGNIDHGDDELLNYEDDIDFELTTMTLLPSTPTGSTQPRQNADSIQTSPAAPGPEQVEQMQLDALAAIRRCVPKLALALDGARCNTRAKPVAGARNEILVIIPRVQGRAVGGSIPVRGCGEGAVVRRRPPCCRRLSGHAAADASRDPPEEYSSHRVDR